MTARVRFYGVMRDIAADRQVVVELPSEFTLGAVVDALSATCGEDVRGALVSSWRYLQGHVKVFVDGQDARGDLDERFGPFGSGQARVDIFFVPMCEGGGE